MNDYEFMESLGAHHPITVSVTVAEAERRERRGLPLPISGDAESDHAKELLRIRQELVASDQSWVLVSADTAAWLEQRGLMEALSNPAGTVANSRLFIPGQTVAEVLASPFSGVVSKGEGVTIPVSTAEGDAYKALAAVQRRLMVGGRLVVAP